MLRDVGAIRPPRAKRTLSRAGVRLIRSHEGFSPRPYRDSVGQWTVGYGSTRGVNASTPRITRQQATERLRREVERHYGRAVRQVGVPLNQRQYDALASFVYNVGPGAVARGTDVGSALRQRNYRKAANAMLEWNKAGGQALPGLTRRRRAERKLFLS